MNLKFHIIHFSYMEISYVKYWYHVWILLWNNISHMNWHFNIEPFILHMKTFRLDIGNFTYEILISCTILSET